MIWYYLIPRYTNMFWKIENWKVVEFYRQLPKAVGNTSLGKNITNEELKELWILPIVWNSEPLEEWQSYWHTTYNILDDKIEQVKAVVNETLDSYKQRKIDELSSKCNSDILSKYSYEEQTNLLRESMRVQYQFNLWQEVDNERVEYIAKTDAEIEARREEYRKQKEDILELTTYQEVKDYVNNLYDSQEI